MLYEKSGGITGPLIEYPGPPMPARPDDPRVDLKELARILRRQRRAILWTAAVPVILTLTYVILATPLYTASTQLLIDPRDRRIITNEVNPETLAADGGVAVVESQLLVLTSDSVLRRAIAREHLDVDPEFGGTPTNVLSRLTSRVLSANGLDSDVATRGDPQLKALRQLKRRISVKRSEKAFVADVYVTTESRDKSVRIADAIAQSYLDDQAEARAAAAHRASTELSARLEALRNRVREAEERAVEYKKQHQIISAGGLLVNEQQLSEMNIRLNDARTRVAEARSRFEQIKRAKQAGVDAGAIPEAVQSQTIGQLRVQYAEVVRHRAELMGRLGPRHPDIQSLNSQVQDLQRQIENELSRIAAAAQSELARAEASERTIEANLENLKSEAVSTNQASVRLRELEREVDASRGVYQAFLVRARETGEQQSIDSSNARVISKATPPRDKSWPPRVLLLAVALIGGLRLGAGVGLMRDYLDETVHTQGQLQQLVPVPVLAALPSLRAKRYHLLPFRKKLARSDRSVVHDAEGMDRELDQVASSMRAMLVKLYGNNRSPSGRTVLISSAGAEEGKTTVALNLAVEAARRGSKVLLVDADFNGHTLSKNPTVMAGAGLFDLLEGRAKLGSVLLHHSDTGLQFLSCGNATRVESQQPMPEIIVQRLVEPARSFGLVVIDSGAVLVDSCVRSFADVVDDILFVVRAGVTKKEDILSAFAALRLSSRKVRGTVLTSVEGNLG